MSYKLIYQSDSIIRLIDGITIPNDVSNKDYQDYLAWVASGNTAQVADEPTQEELDYQQDLIQQPIDTKQWVIDNPVSKQLFDLSISELDIEVTNLINASFPLITTTQRTRWRLLLMVVILSVRIFAKRLGLT